MSLALVNWRLQLVNDRTQADINDNSGVCNVLTAGSPAEVTIYSDKIGTVGSNPLTISKGEIEFWTLDTVTSVDLSILTANGEAIFMRGVSQGENKVEVETEEVRQLLVIPFGAVVAETDTGFDLPANMLVRDCYIKVTTVDATETIDVGILSTETGGDANGFLATMSVATAGYIFPIVIANGVNEAYVSSFDGGALIFAGRVGTDLDQDNGAAANIAYLTDGVAKSISYTGSAGSDTAAGYILVEYDKLF